MAARQCTQTRRVVAEVYHTPSEVCIIIRVGYGGFSCMSFWGKVSMVYPYENALDRDILWRCDFCPSICGTRHVGPDLLYEFVLDIVYDIYGYRIWLMVCKLEDK